VRTSERLTVSDFSFDVVSKVEKQGLEDAVNQASREIATRPSNCCAGSWNAA